jgi:hypothetical protein
LGVFDLANGDQDMGGSAYQAGQILICAQHRVSKDPSPHLLLPPHQAGDLKTISRLHDADTGNRVSARTDQKNLRPLLQGVSPASPGLLGKFKIRRARLSATCKSIRGQAANCGEK